MDQQDWDELARKLGKVADAAPDACGAPCLVADCRRRISPPLQEVPATGNVVPFRPRERLARQGGVK